MIATFNGDSFEDADEFGDAQPASVGSLQRVSGRKGGPHRWPSYVNASGCGRKYLKSIMG